MVDTYLLLKKAEDELADYIRRNIPDPRGPDKRPKGRFVEHGKEHYEGKTPRITIKRNTTIPTPYTGVGEKTQDFNEIFNMLIEVAPGQDGIVNATKYGGPELLNILAGRLSYVMELYVAPADVYSGTVIKEVKRVSTGPYAWNPVTRVHFNLQRYEVYIVNPQ